MKCPFCSESSNKCTIYEEKGFRLIYNIAPILPGHSLVIPTRHISSINNLTENEIALFFQFARKSTQSLIKIFNAQGFDWTIQDGHCAGQTINHLHLHIILRYKSDFPDPGDWYPALQNTHNQHLDSTSRKRLSEKEINEISLYIKNQIKRN